MTAPLTVVTGGSRGIGAAICRRLAADGHDVVVGFVNDVDAADSVVRDIEALGRRALAVRVDTADEAAVDSLFDEARDFGILTGLVNNAGVRGSMGPLVSADVAGIRRALEVNVLGYLLCARRAVRDLGANGGGAIVNISSVAATLGGAGSYVHYAAGKTAVDGMTVGLAKEVAEQGIRVNAVSPGTIWTEFHEDPDRPAKVAPTVPMGRAGHPEEIAGAVSWLLSPDASYTTGANLKVSGGL